MSTVFLIDLDKTLIDQTYRPTMKIAFFTNLIDRLVARGDIFILCSDSALDTLLYWRKFFHFNGPIIYENGAAIDWDSGKQQPTLTPIFNGVKLKKELKQKLMHLFPQAKIIERNYLSIIGQPKGFTHRKLIVFNPYRRYSVSMHALILNGDYYVYDTVLAQDIANYLQDFIYTKGIESKIKLETNLEYAISILKPLQVNKKLALPFIKQKYPNYQLVVIGDGLQESFMANSVDKVWAVANACSQLKQLAHEVAGNSITQGVYDLLTMYYQQLKNKK